MNDHLKFSHDVTREKMLLQSCCIKMIYQSLIFLCKTSYHEIKLAVKLNFELNWEMVNLSYLHLCIWSTRRRHFVQRWGSLVIAAPPLHTLFLVSWFPPLRNRLSCILSPQEASNFQRMERRVFSFFPLSPSFGDHCTHLRADDATREAALRLSERARRQWMWNGAAARQTSARSPERWLAGCFAAACQRYKKIIDLDLKDWDHLIDLDLMHDLDHYWWSFVGDLDKNFGTLVSGFQWDTFFVLKTLIGGAQIGR